LLLVHAPPTPGVPGDADLAAVAAVLADRTRARILLALGDGRSLPASVLATEAGVAASTASQHLARLVTAGLVTVTPRGRYRYYRLAGPQVGELIEALARLAPTQPVTSLRESTRAHAVRRARSCYDHLAGRLGVALTDALLRTGSLTGHDDHPNHQIDSDGEVGGGAEDRLDLDRMSGARPAGDLPDPVDYTLTPTGRTLLTDLGARLPAGNAVRCCLDWTEQRHHLAGPHGRALLTALLDRDWLRHAPRGRALLLTDTGATGLTDTLGVQLP
jgi:DNA-binding transcriptional ArsR family regulator